MVRVRLRLRLGGGSAILHVGSYLLTTICLVVTICDEQFRPKYVLYCVPFWFCHLLLWPLLQAGYWRRGFVVKEVYSQPEMWGLISTDINMNGWRQKAPMLQIWSHFMRGQLGMSKLTNGDGWRC